MMQLNNVSVGHLSPSQYLKHHFKRLVHPNLYQAFSIDDFKTERKSLEGISLLRLVGNDIFYFSRGHPLKFAHTYKLGDARVDLPDVYYTILPEDENLVELSDTTGSLILPIWSKRLHNKDIITQDIRNGDKIQNAAIVYNVKSDTAKLFYMDKIENRPAASKQADSLDGLVERMLLRN